MELQKSEFLTLDFLCNLSNCSCLDILPFWRWQLLSKHILWVLNSHNWLFSRNTTKLCCVLFIRHLKDLELQKSEFLKLDWFHNWSILMWLCTTILTLSKHNWLGVCEFWTDFSLPVYVISCVSTHFKDLEL